MTQSVRHFVHSRQKVYSDHFDSGVSGSDWAENELCVDEPEEMLVDDPDDIVSLTELLEGVSVDGPLTPVSHWIGES